MSIPENQDFIDALARGYLAPEPSEATTANGQRRRIHVGAPGPADDEIIELCRKAKNAAKFEPLFDRGDTSAYGGDDSRADMALIGIFAFYTQDPDQIERLMRRSALNRSKWDKRRTGTPWIRYSITRGLAGTRETYTPPRSAPRPDLPPGEEAGAPNPLLAGRVLLRKAMEDGIEPPDELEEGVLLRGKVHQIFSASGLGKTMLALWLVKRCIDRGQLVVYFDDENGARTISERLQDMGTDPARVDELLYYLPFPSLPMTDEARRNYVALLEEIKPKLVVFDSWINFLASAGLSENENTDVQVWCTAYTKPARDRGITTVLLDHVPHEGGRPRGASRKKDEADVQWQLYRTKHFDRNSVGEIVLHREKDRDDWLDPSVKFSVGGTGDGRLIFGRSAGTVEEPDPADGLTDSARKLLEVLRLRFAETGASASEWAKAADVSRQAVYRCRDTLTGRGLIRLERNRYYPIPAPDDGGESVTSPPSGPEAAVTPDQAPSGEGVTLNHESSVTPESLIDKPDSGEVSHGVPGCNTDPDVTEAGGVTVCNTPPKGVLHGVTPAPTSPPTPRGERRKQPPDGPADHPLDCECLACSSPPRRYARPFSEEI